MNAVTHGLAGVAMWMRNRGERTRGEERSQRGELWFELMTGLV
jgi:hypothetical protein